jgi:hypothetical protein
MGSVFTGLLMRSWVGLLVLIGQVWSDYGA